MEALTDWLDRNPDTVISITSAGEGMEGLYMLMVSHNFGQLHAERTWKYFHASMGPVALVKDLDMMLGELAAVAG